MPARVNKIRHDENTRTKIKVAEIINRFQRHIDGEIELTPTQVSCGKILLDRALPCLQSVEISGEITTSKVIRAPAIASTVQSWTDQHSPHARTEH